MPTNSARLASGSLPGATRTLIFTAPPNQITLLKSGVVSDLTSDGSYWPMLELTAPDSGGNSVWVPYANQQSFPGGSGQTYWWDTWQVLMPGDQVYLQTQDDATYRLSGALLLSNL